jgi:hypothetical protein
MRSDRGEGRVIIGSIEMVIRLIQKAFLGSWRLGSAPRPTLGGLQTRLVDFKKVPPAAVAGS